MGLSRCCAYSAQQLRGVVLYVALRGVRQPYALTSLCGLPTCRVKPALLALPVAFTPRFFCVRYSLSDGRQTFPARTLGPRLVHSIPRCLEGLRTCYIVTAPP